MVAFFIGTVLVIGVMWLSDVRKNGIKSSAKRLWKEFF